MMINFRNSLIFFFCTTVCSGVGYNSALALDNLEPENVLNQAIAQGSLAHDNTLSHNGITTELLSICCPTAKCPGTIDYTLATPRKVAMCVYDQDGSEVVELVDRTQTSGYHLARWDGCAEDGEAVPGGTYFLLLKADESVFLRRLVIK